MMLQHLATCCAMQTGVLISVTCCPNLQQGFVKQVITLFNLLYDAVVRRDNVPVLAARVDCFPSLMVNAICVDL